MIKGNDIKTIAVIGAGTMGPGITEALIAGGKTVKIWEPFEENRVKAAKRIHTDIDLMIQNGIVSAENSEKLRESVGFSGSLEEAVKDVQLIMETIVERADIKESFYKELLPFVKEDTIVASNTSALNVFELVPEELLKNMLIAHWYAPANVVPLVEVVKSEKAPQWMADAVVDMLNSCGKAPVLMNKFIRGYIVNRIQQCISREVYYLLDNEYCTAEDIDNAVKMSFAPRAMVLGICKKNDVSGTNMNINNYKNKSYHLPPETEELPKCLQKLEDEQAYGVKSGKGFYDYTGVDIDEMMKKMDNQLVLAYELAKKFMDNPV